MTSIPGSRAKQASRRTRRENRRPAARRRAVPPHGRRRQGVARYRRSTAARAGDQRMRPQVETLVLNANGDPARFASFGLPVVPDSVPDYAGPLAGVLAGLDWTAAHRPD